MIREHPSHFIFWDLDRTLGNFKGILHEKTGAAVPEWDQPLSLRYGIRELLAEFSQEAGYAHYVTTSGSVDYAIEALQRTVIAESFQRIFGNDTVGYGFVGKRYKQVANAAGFTNEGDIQANIIVIGDSGTDKPTDIAGLVFLELGQASHDALVIREILTTLLDTGDGNFKKGFDALYESTSLRANEDETQDYRTLDLGNGIQFQLSYRPLMSANKGAKEVPVITPIEAKRHEKNWIIIP